MANFNPISADLVKHIAKLAHLNLSEKEVGFYVQQLAKIIEYVDQLNEVEIKNQKVSSPVEKPSERDDQVKQFNNLEQVFNQAPEIRGHSFKVPKIIDTI